MNIQGYLDYINSPWGKLFYRLVWHNLDFSGKRILDFGSGFGVTANYLSENNEVVAVEPNGAMLDRRISDNSYRQIIGGIDEIRKMEDSSFDVIICHNVLEYTDKQEELFKEFHRLLKSDGILSIVKHNKAGKIMHKAVFEYNPEEALALIHNKNSESVNFGVIKEYDISDLEKYCGNRFVIKEIYGIRTFYGLQNNDLKSHEEWADRMFELEIAVESNPLFRDIAFFHHLIVEKVKI